MKRLLRLSLLAALCCVSSPLLSHNLDEATYQAITPYFLPVDHPLQKKLAKIFTKSKRPIFSLATLRMSGFEYLGGNLQTTIKVLRHPDLKGYVIKVFLDDSWFPNDWYNFWKRCRGAEAVRQAILAHGWEDEFEAPQKWIYELPEPKKRLPAEVNQKYFILIAKDAKIASYEENKILWKSSAISEEKLIKLHTLMKETGLVDSVYIDNIPFTKNGKIAFVDTEHFHRWPIPYYKLLPFLNTNKKDFWFSITSQ